MIYGKNNIIQRFNYPWGEMMCIIEKLRKEIFNLRFIY